MKTVAAKDAKNRFGQLIDDAQRGPVTIEKNGRPYAVVQSYEHFELSERTKLDSLRTNAWISPLLMKSNPRVAGS